MANLIELVRITGCGVRNFNNLIKLHAGFGLAYSKFISDIITFGQYNTLKLQNLMDKLPKTYRGFFDELFESAEARELLLKICLIFGGDEALVNNKSSVILLVSKVLLGIYLVDLNDVINKVFPNRYQLRHIDRLHIENLGKKPQR